MAVQEVNRVDESVRHIQRRLRVFGEEGLGLFEEHVGRFFITFQIVPAVTFLIEAPVRMRCFYEKSIVS